jgi:hypothetical protein
LLKLAQVEIFKADGYSKLYQAIGKFLDEKWITDKANEEDGSSVNAGKLS